MAGPQNGNFDFLNLLWRADTVCYADDGDT